MGYSAFQQTLQQTAYSFYIFVASSRLEEILISNASMFYFCMYVLLL